MLRGALSSLSPAGARARLSILIFHRVLAAPDLLHPGEVDAARFDRICSWVRAWFNVLPLDEAERRRREGTLPARAMCLTFDDGYRDNHDLALSILQRHGLNATFFVASGFIDGGCMWNDIVIEAVRRTPQRILQLGGVGDLPLGTHPVTTIADKRAAIRSLLGDLKYLPQAQRQRAAAEIAQRAGVEPPDDLMMSRKQLRTLRAAGMTIGAHTVSHPILARVDRAAAAREIERGKQMLESLLDEPVTLFAYPNGKPVEDFGDEHVQLAREAGFACAVTTAWGAASAATDPYRLPRFTPWDASRLRFGLRLARNLSRH